MERIKTKDTVVVISGKEKGKTGLVLEVSRKRNGLVKVKDVMMVTKHQKARGMGMTAGLKRREAWIEISKVMPLCTSCQKATRVKVKVSDAGIAARACSRCQEVF